ncbi:hypothetical protein [Actinoplanes derwentensis]|uniref:Uncharacterized protein n=1 Tax=Actinoplanes derwentensis TaxID=113562 RepID=A0A1H2CCA6_9ACTN|nr:hypothetical protein [Actinoplanes derwentensis]GID87317.1 hypothetical protein Ade03nite_62410 [Actinoplanes derwentensis]SDT68128.1 hypothetical protein SAMN04489716_5576 [Actinoplanes derwentensis]
MTTDLPDDFTILLRLTADVCAEFTADRVDGLTAARQILRERLRTDADARTVFTLACTFASPFGESWVHGAGDGSPYLSLELAAATLDEDQYRALLATVVLSDSTTLPYDYRALAAAALGRMGLGVHRAALQEAVDSATPLPMRSIESKTMIRSDGIDHLFAIPDMVEGRLAILRQAAAAKTAETRVILAARLLGHPGPAAPVSPYMSNEAERLIAEDAANELVRPADYLVPWDQELADDGSGGRLTLAELLRVALLCPEFKLPDVRVRPILIAFYRSVLRVSGRAIVGLGAGVFHVEHGTAAHASYFYLGRDAVLGKGCVIDCVGGAVLQHSSFLGGGFVPLLIHTHKHVRRAGELGTAERKTVLPCVFAAETGARLPMSAVGLYEAADHLDADPTPFPGIRSLALAP